MKKIYKLITTSFVLASVVSTQSFAQPVYCGQQATSTADDEIFNVTLGTLNNTSACGALAPGPGSQPFMYSNYTSGPGAPAAPSMTIGTTQTVAVTVGQCNGFAYSGNMYVWIDFNANGVLNDPGEMVYTAAGVFNVAGSVFTSPNWTVPITSVLGPTRMRVTAVEGSVGGPCGNFTWGETEDYNVNIIGIPCAGAPAANTVNVAPAGLVCPGSTAAISLANSYSFAGLTYSWVMSTTSPVGPFVSAGISTSLTSFISPTLSGNVWYQCIITCTNGGANTTANTGTVLVQNTTTNTVPYFEGFEGVSYNGQLPNCSWSRSTSSLSCQTYTLTNTLNRVPRTGSKFASFFFSPGGTNAFYTNGIFLNAGVTYSANLWYTTEGTGFTNFTDLSITVGNAQTPAAQTTTIVSSNGPALSPIHKALGNTFTVATSGLYYVAVRATYNASGANYLSWDDLSITIPCNFNTPAVSVTGPTVACEGAPLSLNANGANSYVWNTGATTSGLNTTPIGAGLTPYTVVGTNTLTGCSATVMQNVLVNPSPVVSIFASSPTLCAGSSVNLAAFGAMSYQWSNSMTGNFITVKPSVTTIYTVSGVNQYNCAGTNTQQIIVNPAPNVGASASSTNICVGEALTLTGSGASTYQWTSPSLFSVVNPVSLTPPASAIYTLTGWDAQGCAGVTQIQVAVNACTGINKVSAANGINVYPNPNSGIFTIEMTAGAKSVEVVDVTGRVIMATNTNESVMNINISTLSNGIYYVKIKSNNASEVVKVVKH